jgi:cell division protein FtsL
MGTTGRMISILMATGLLVLSVTGIVMYLQMYRMRKKVNRHGWIWK